MFYYELTSKKKKKRGPGVTSHTTVLANLTTLLSLCLRLSLRDAHNSNDSAVKVINGETFDGHVLISNLKASGFRQVPPDDRTLYFLPCPLGTFSNFSSRGTEGCTPCPPGMVLAPS